jgi:hypothetical protein
MGKRSRLVATRREKRLRLEKLSQIRALTNLRALAFCFLVATFSERQGAPSAIEWMCKYCYMSEKEAEESIAIGRRMMARVAVT